jgi:predicted nucleic acid-binding protein
LFAAPSNGIFAHAQEANGENQALILARTAAGSGGGDRVPDAHLAAPAIEHGLTLCSTDRGFARFSELKWRNPLVSRA